jgi:cyclophilin family peptidyl-prolyl cis-trans isomerase
MALRSSLLATSHLVLAAALLLGTPNDSAAQLTTRVSILQAEDRRAPTAQDLGIIRAGARSADGQTARIGVRALGRLERPALIPDILISLRHRLPEVRAEAANALAQAAQGMRTGATSPVTLASVQSALIARLTVDDDPDVRAAVCESIARLPYTSADDVERAETALFEFAGKPATNTDRLGLAKGLEALVRLQRDIRRPGARVVDTLTELVRRSPARPEQDLLRDARVRRLALESLILLDAADAATVLAAAADPDMQVRRLAVRAAAAGGPDAAITRALNDPAAMVRIEALRASRQKNAAETCSPALAAASDPDTAVALVAIDQLGPCDEAADAVAYLAGAVADIKDAEAPRNWHRAAHALVALATARPEEASSAVPAFAASQVWQLRMYGARAATVLNNREVLERLARDANANVAEAAIAGLMKAAGHDADALYISALGRDAVQVVRAAALALDGTSAAAALPALQSALSRLENDAHPGAADARSALGKALTALRAPVNAKKTPLQPAPITAEDLRRLASPRARFTIRDVGVFDVALFTMEAPATVLRFAQLASSGYYDGLTFHRIVPNGVIQGGSPGANEYSSDAPLMRDEVGMWPHVRGGMGISTRGRDTGDAQIFVDLVDNPRYDHTYTVFAQVLNGMDVVDRILEGDVIEKVEIVP